MNIFLYNEVFDCENKYDFYLESILKNKITALYS